MLQLSTQRDIALANAKEADAQLLIAESIKTMTEAQLLAYRGRDSGRSHSIRNDF
jgi:hypothetical protein